MPVSGSKIRSGVTTHSPGQWRRLGWRWIWTVAPSWMADWVFSAWPPCSSCTAKRRRWFWRRSVHALLLCLVRVSPRLVSYPCVNYSVHFIVWSASVRVSLRTSVVTRELACICSWYQLEMCFAESRQPWKLSSLSEKPVFFPALCTCTYTSYRVDCNSYNVYYFKIIYESNYIFHI